VSRRRWSDAESDFWSDDESDDESGAESDGGGGVKSGVEMLLDIEMELKLLNHPVPFRSALGGVNALIKHYQVRSFHTTSTCY